MATPEMTTDSRSRIFAAIAKLGSANFVEIVLRIGRVKLLAMLFGPVGIGILGLYTSIIQTFASAAALGLGESSVRLLAGHHQNPVAVWRVQAVLLIAGGLQALLVALMLLLFSDQLAAVFFDVAGISQPIGVIVPLLGAGLVLTVLGQFMRYILQSQRRISSLAWAMGFSAALGTTAMITCILVLGTSGIIYGVVALLLCDNLVKAYIIFRASRLSVRRLLRFVLSAEFWRKWWDLFQMGYAIVLSVSFALGAMLFLRAMILDKLGLEYVGYFQAGFLIATVYLMYLISAMEAEFTPRLSQTVKAQAPVDGIINEQMQILLAIGGPVLIALIGATDLVLTLLYDASFRPAVEMLQWMLLGSLVLLPTWPLRFLFITTKQAAVINTVTIVRNVTFVAVSWTLFAPFGLVGVGIAFGSFTLLVAAILIGFSYRLHHFRFESASLWFYAAFLGISVMVMGLARWDSIYGLCAAAVLAPTMGLICLRQITHGKHG